MTFAGCVVITVVGFTVTVNVVGVPTQLLAVGVTIIVAITGDVPGLFAVYAGIFPVPLVPKPTLMDEVHEKLVPLTGPLKLIAVPEAPLQCILLEILLTVAVGLTVIVNVDGVPVHPFAAGVIPMVAVIGELNAFVVVKEGISPEPFAARPILVLLFVHVNIVPLTGPDKLVSAATAPSQ